MTNTPEQRGATRIKALDNYSRCGRCGHVIDVGEDMFYWSRANAEHVSCPQYDSDIKGKGDQTIAQMLELCDEMSTLIADLDRFGSPDYAGVLKTLSHVDGAASTLRELMRIQLALWAERAINLD